MDHMDKQIKVLVPFHPLSNIKIITFSIYAPRFNGVFSKHNLPTIKDGACVITLNDKQSKGTPYVLLFMDRNNFGVLWLFWN